jgi:hypothetical protein
LLSPDGTVRTNRMPAPLTPAFNDRGRAEAVARLERASRIAQG